jgi:hypothetical protein
VDDFSVAASLAGAIGSVDGGGEDLRPPVKMAEFEDVRAFFYGLSREIPLATSGQGDLDIYSPSGVMTMQIKTAVSEHEVAMLKARIRRAARQKAERGVPQWRRAFGFIEGDSGPEVDPATGPLVAEAYAAVLAGGSISDVARRFNTAGALGLTGKPWTASTVSAFLRKARNAGLRWHNGGIVGPGNWPALVSEETWRAVQAIIDAPHRKRPRSVTKHLLTGVMACGKCGVPMGGSHTLAKAIRYVCKSPDCRGVSVLAMNVEPVLFDAVAGRLAMPDAVELLKAEERDAAEAERLPGELAVLYARLETIGVAVGEGDLTPQQARAATETVNAKIAKLELAQQDTERLHVFDGIPLGTEAAVEAIKALSPDRFRAILDVLLSVTVEAVGKGSHNFDPTRVPLDWK